MRSNMIILALCLMAASAQQTYQLVWSDEFNGNSLDMSKWQYEVNCDGGGNAEMQCYTNSPANVAVKNGSLYINAIAQNLNGKQFTSGRINTKASAAWKYGRIDFSAKTPNGIYTWPALWMMPRDNVYGMWAASGEIDIMESRGTQNSQESTLHFGGGWPNNIYQGSGPQTQSFDMTAGFHLYSAIWTPTSIQFLIDNTVYYTQTLQRNFWNAANPNPSPYSANGQPFDQYFYIIINLAVGGGFFGGDANTLTPAMAQQWKSNSLVVDYVRVYQLQNSVTPTPAPAPAPAPVASTTAAPASTTTPACSSMWSTLSCRTASQNPAQVDAGKVTSSRNWLCSSYPQFCTQVTNGGQFAGCNSVEQLSYAMTQYYNTLGGALGPSACDFSGLASIVQQSAAPVTPTPVAVPSTTATPTPVATPATSASSAAPCARAGYCSPSMCACNGACYDISQYCCVNNSLTQISFCPK